MTRPLDIETPFGMTVGACVDDAITWVERERQRLHAPDCSVHTPSPRCGCGLHGLLNNLRAVKNSLTSVPAVSKAATDVLAERERQVTAEGWTPEHDDDHNNGELAKAAACYALQSACPGNQGDYLRFWPVEWASSWWKPKDCRSDLVKAGALILAEIERIDRARGVE